MGWTRERFWGECRMDDISSGLGSEMESRPGRGPGKPEHSDSLRMIEEPLNFQMPLKEEFLHPTSNLVQLPTDPSPGGPGCLKPRHSGE